MKKNSKKQQIDWDKALVCGITLGWMMSMLYLLLILTSNLTA